MRKQQIDLSGIPMSKGLVQQMFGHMLPARYRWMANLYKDDGGITTSGQAFQAAFVQLLIIILTSLVYTGLIFALKAVGDHIGNKDISKNILRLGAAGIGLPIFMTLISTLSGFFDLIYFGLFHERANTAAASGVKYLKIMCLVLGFVFLITSTTGFILYMEFSIEDQKKIAVLKTEQIEYLKHLDQGRHVWNLYITRTPQHAIDFSYADLSGRDFTGYYFSSVKFDHANLQNTIFDDCYLSGAWLRHTNCRGASFKKAYMTEYTYFEGADLTDADFTGAFAEIRAIEKAEKKPVKLDRIESPKKSHWKTVGWESFHTQAWIDKSSYYISRDSQSRIGTMLKDIPPELKDLLKDR